MAENENLFGTSIEPSEHQEIGDDFFGGSTKVKTKPEDVQNIEDEEDEQGPKATAKKVDPVKKADPKKPIAKKQETKQEEEEVEEVDEEKIKSVVETDFFGTGKDKEEASDEEELDKEEKDDDEAETEEEQQGVSPFEVISKQLFTLGIFKPEIDEATGEPIAPALPKTPEEFKQAFEYQTHNKAVGWVNNILTQHGEDRRELFDAIFVNGVDPKEYLPLVNSIEVLKDLTLDTEENQERVVREFYKRSKLPDDKIDRQIKRLKDLSELQSTAEDFHPQLIEQDEQRAAEMVEASNEALLNEQRADADYKKSIAAILTEKLKTKEFDGIPVNDKEAQEAYDFLYTKKYKAPDGKKLTEFDKFVIDLNKPENHALKVKAALLFKRKLDLSKVQKKAVSKEASELFSELTTKKTKAASTKQKSTASSWNL